MFRRKKRRFLPVPSDEKSYGQEEEPEQQPKMNEDVLIVRHEVTRLWVLGVLLFVLLLSFLSFLLAHPVVPLFLSIILTSITYGCLDRHFRASEHAPPF